MRTNTIIGITSLGMFLLAGCASDVPEQGKEGDSKQPSANAASPTCVLHATTREQTCYSSFTDAMSVATNGRINDAPANSGLAVQDQALTARVNALGASGARATATEPTDTPQGVSPERSRSLSAYTVGQGNVVLAYLYEHEWYNYYGAINGKTMIVVGTKPCTDSVDDVDYDVYWIGSWMNDTVTSFSGMNNCCLRLFWDDNFGGASYWSCNTDNIGSDFNDEASSFIVT